ncbi:hypothetical protein N7452_001527 [Penicillium brevicompactum]|uniref:Uncharacterized protein n=1 Tax=Penicillium brevicompactum TaxID=5074 RepID=A0A9W9UPB3_PENBR|nr:hypothetical protein N7452_001527 [Penicillium brevicompactum]
MSSSKQPYTDLFKPGTSISSALAHKIASTSHWGSHTLFISFMADKPIEVIREVRDRQRAITWDLRSIQHLRTCLRTWTADEIPSEAIGAFLVNLLYERDYHLGYELTALVRADKTAAQVGRRAMYLYQIHDKTGKPLWDQKAVPKLGSGTKSLLSVSERADPRWHTFLDQLSEDKLEELMDTLGDNPEDESSILTVFSGIGMTNMPIIHTFHRFAIHADDHADVYTQLRESAKGLEGTGSEPDSFATESLVDALPSLSELICPSPVPEVNVRTFKVEGEKKIRFAPDTKPGMVNPANSVQEKNRASSSDPKPAVDVISSLPRFVSDGGASKYFTESGARRPGLRRMKKSRNFRLDRERDAQK